MSVILKSAWELGSLRLQHSSRAEMTQTVWPCCPSWPSWRSQPCTRASLNPPSNWRRPRGRPRQTWLQTISDDLKHLKRGIHSAYRQVQDRSLWRKIVETAMLTQWVCHLMIMTTIHSSIKCRAIKPYYYYYLIMTLAMSRLFISAVAELLILPVTMNSDQRHWPWLSNLAYLWSR